MSKAFLILEMPSSCEECPLLLVGRYCKAKEAPNVAVDSNLNKSKPDWCPLRELPEKKKYGETLKIAIENDCYDGTTEDKAYFNGYDKGYNACIDELFGYNPYQE